MTAPRGWTQAQSPTLGARAYIRRDGLAVIVTDDHAAADGSSWLHVSFSRRTRMPEWSDVRAVREAFVPADRDAAVILPRENEYVDDHPYCLHLWSRNGGRSVPDMRIVEPCLGRRSV